MAGPTDSATKNSVSVYTLSPNWHGNVVLPCCGVFVPLYAVRIVGRAVVLPCVGKPVSSRVGHMRTGVNFGRKGMGAWPLFKLEFQCCEHLIASVCTLLVGTVQAVDLHILMLDEVDLTVALLLFQSASSLVGSTGPALRSGTRVSPLSCGFWY